MSSSEATIAWQARRIERLEAEVAYYRELAGVDLDAVQVLRAALRCQPAGARILLRLYKARDYATRAQLAYAAGGRAGPESASLKVQICQVRRRLPARSIVTVANTGYRLSLGGRALVRDLLETATCGNSGHLTPTSTTSSPTS